MENTGLLGGLLPMMTQQGFNKQKKNPLEGTGINPQLLQLLSGGSPAIGLLTQFLNKN